MAQSDIVIGIIRSELRPGTSRELYHAIRLRKPLLLVKLESGTSPEIESLLRYAREMDACTYVGRPNDSGLVPYLMDQLNNVMVDLFHNRDLKLKMVDRRFLLILLLSLFPKMFSMLSVLRLP